MGQSPGSRQPRATEARATPDWWAGPQPALAQTPAAPYLGVHAQGSVALDEGFHDAVVGGRGWGHEHLVPLNSVQEGPEGPHHLWTRPGSGPGGAGQTDQGQAPGGRTDRPGPDPRGGTDRPGSGPGGQDRGDQGQTPKAGQGRGGKAERTHLAGRTGWGGGLAPGGLQLLILQLLLLVQLTHRLLVAALPPAER